MAYLHTPQRVAFVYKQPQHEISRCGCFPNATTRCGLFSAQWAFSIFNINIQNVAYSEGQQPDTSKLLTQVEKWTDKRNFHSDREGLTLEFK